MMCEELSVKIDDGNNDAGIYIFPFHWIHITGSEFTAANFFSLSH